MLSERGGFCAMKLDTSKFHGVYLLVHYPTNVYNVIMTCQALEWVRRYSSERDTRSGGRRDFILMGEEEIKQTHTK